MRNAMLVLLLALPGCATLADPYVWKTLTYLLQTSVEIANHIRDAGVSDGGSRVLSLDGGASGDGPEADGGL